MLLIHAAQKLLNTSGIKAALYITEPSEGQLMHSWYARLLSTGFAGKLMVLYCHEPSMLTIVCSGKTIRSTFPEFVIRLKNLMHRFHFKESVIENELPLADAFIVSKTDSKRQLGYMNSLVVNLEIHCRRSLTYNEIDLDLLEEVAWTMPYWLHGKTQKIFKPGDYWRMYLENKGR